MTNPNSKGDLIARLLALGQGNPAFDASASGPAHDRIFRVSVSASGRVLGVGEGRTKREAERLAAEQALRTLEAPGSTSHDHDEETCIQAVWPIYAQVLAESVEAAIEFADEDATLQEVQRQATHFYKALLTDLGHGPAEE